MQTQEPRLFSTGRDPRGSQIGTTVALLTFGVMLAVGLSVYIAVSRFHFTPDQVLEFAVYFTVGILGIPSASLYFLLTRRSRREKAERHPPLVVSKAKDRAHVAQAWAQSAVVLGYNIHGEPWLWPDKVRVMQGIVLGQTGSGKTTLLRNIITQDLERRVGPPNDRHKVPMVIFDGKGDLQFFHDLLPHIHRAGRLQDLRLLNPARPDLSCLYNPF
jgi:hypothetical protein